MSDIYFWGILAVVTGIIATVFVIRKKKSTSAISYNTYLIFSIVMMCIGILTLILKRGDNICAILYGITFLKITYNDRHNYPPKFTISYIDHLKGYFVGYGSIFYGLFRFFE